MKTALIVAFGDTGNESEALRQTLEAFGMFVATKYIGRPNDFVAVLRGEVPIDTDFIIFSCHGDEGKFIMPVLGENIYTPDEPRGNLGGEDVEKFLGLSGKIIISLGCTTGQEKTAAAFSVNNVYIAPEDYVEGRSALFFAIKFFYELLQNGKDEKNAYELAKSSDTETSLFRFYAAE